MIKNDKQYQVTKKRLGEFFNALAEVNNQVGLDPLLKQIQEGAIKSQIADFEKEIREYETLKKGIVNYIFIDSFDNIHEALIKGRLVNGLSQSDLAKRLDLKEQQIQRYESCNYSTASLPRIQQIANELGVSFSPIKVKFKEPHFAVPLGFTEEKISKAQNFLKERKSLISVN